MKILDEDLKLCKSKTDDGEQLVWLPCCVDFGSRRTVRVYVSTVLFLFSGVKTVMFFLCTVERCSIIKPVFCISLKAISIIRKSANQMKVWDAKLQGL